MVLELSIILALILVNGFFAGAEIAVVSLRRSRLDELVETGSGAARAVQRLRDAPERFLATVQVAITVVSAAAAAYGGASLAADLTPLLARVPWFGQHTDDVALTLVIVGVSYLSVVLGELVPKSLALRNAEAYALWVGRFVLALSWLARPVVWLLTVSSNLVLKPFGDSTTFTEARHSPDELKTLVEDASQAGTLDPRAAAIASRALDLPRLTAADVMVPRRHVVTLRRHASPDELRRVLLEQTHSRFPISEGRDDRVVGYVSVRDLLALAWEQRLIVLEDVMRPAYFVPGTVAAVALLKQMQQSHQPFAIVVDEHGGMDGIVTLEDLLQELVGDLFSERSRKVVEPIAWQPDGTAIVSGVTPLRVVNRALELALPEDGDFTTIAGLCLSRFGHIPHAGERLALPGGVSVEVADASPRRVRAVRLHRDAMEQSPQLR